MSGPKRGNSRALAWAHGVVSVESLGGMLGPTLFVLPEGRQIAPFHIAPWADETGNGELPGVLRRLRGEWPCVPFGGDADRAPRHGWPGSTATPTLDAEAHGHGSNADWIFGAASPVELALAIDYPDNHPVRRLERRIIPDPKQAAIDFELAISMRHDCDLPIGLHPCIRLPHIAGGMHIEMEGKIAGATLPGDVDPSAILAPGQIAEDWHMMRLRDGSCIDPSRVPLPRHTEDLVQLLGVPGRVALHNTIEGYRLRMSWNPEHFPSLLLWNSNYGRQFAPWNGRHLALGVEPICSAFDLGPQISAANNPIAARGVPTSRKFSAGEMFVTRYRVAVEAA